MSLIEKPDHDNPEGGQWWYVGNECEARRDGKHNDGRTCSGIDSHGYCCGPCHVELLNWLEHHLSFCDMLRDDFKANFTMWLTAQCDKKDV